ncbi:HNH endonuclease [Leptolyngbya sp. FACHB-36]|uniref:HNH endonuclease n=1 Tax=Leptolyngbya sp. FACHB-36 TaxID=2692808 RepID=UPI0016809BF1|nr:HNH endonuclease [Leptolyngbya sp. FACHB-36]MBD2021105.1 HNH endonuclease [Leptolyngbya sp. FACHB-36]
MSNRWAIPGRVCELCERDVAALTEHHLTPRQKTKRKHLDPGPTIALCPACHRQIQVLFDHNRLARDLNTAEALKRDPQMQKFLAWVSKQDPNKRVKVDRKLA